MKFTEQLNRLKHNHDAKTLVGNFMYLSLLRAVSFVFPLITLPYLSRVIGADKFGVIAYASAIMIIVETITDWGFNFTATRDVAKNREDLAEASRIFSEVFFAKIALMMLCFLGLCIIIECVPSVREYRLVLLLTFLYIPGQILFPEWLFQAFEQMKYITILNVLSKTVFTVMIFFVIKTKADYVYQPLLVACGFFVSGAIAQWVIWKNLKVRLRLPNWSSVYMRLRQSTNMFISLILPNLYTNFSTIILKSYCGEVATGIYSGGQKFQNIIDQLTQILSRTFFPFLSRHREKHHIYVLITGAISVAACLGMFFGADLFVKWFLTEEFADAATVIRIFSLTPFFLFLMNSYGTNYLVIVGREDILRNIIVVVSLLGFCLTWWLTRVYGYIGASITISVVWGIRGFATWVFATKIKRTL